jgi:hypothetical protein
MSTTDSDIDSDNDSDIEFLEILEYLNESRRKRELLRAVVASFIVARTISQVKFLVTILGISLNGQKLPGPLKLRFT